MIYKILLMKIETQILYLKYIKNDINFILKNNNNNFRSNNF